MVRAKVALFSMPPGAEGLARANGLRQYRRYADLAESYSAIPSRFLAITSGVSAVGKSHVALRTVEALGAIRLRSDVERKRLFGEQQGESNALHDGIYAEEASVKTYARLHALADGILAAGFPVTIDATYLKREQRAAAAHVAETRGVPFLILECNAPEAVIASWLQQRQSENTDPSDATLEVVQAQLASREPLTTEETLLSKRVETNESDSLDKLVRQIRDRLPGL